MQFHLTNGQAYHVSCFEETNQSWGSIRETCHWVPGTQCSHCKGTGIYPETVNTNLLQAIACIRNEVARVSAKDTETTLTNKLALVTQLEDVVNTLKNKIFVSLP